MQLITIHQNIRRRKNPRLAKLNAEHSAYIQSILGNHKASPTKAKAETSLPKKVPTSDTIPGPAFKKSVDDYKWKRDREEKRETILEIERKKTRIAPGWNKGGYTYISDNTDPTTLGRKI